MFSPLDVISFWKVVKNETVAGEVENDTGSSLSESSFKWHAKNVLKFKYIFNPNF